MYNEHQQDAKADELKRFKEAYNWKKPELYGKAYHDVNAASMNKTRRPEKHVTQKEMKDLNDKMCKEIKNRTSNFCVSKYTWLRSLIVCRLTLYNGRHGEEPARMLISEWADAINDVWVPPSEVEKVTDEAEKYLLGKFKLVYLHGKGKLQYWFQTTSLRLLPCWSRIVKRWG